MRALGIVTCSKEKIWDVRKNAPPRVPAREAYRGTFTRLAVKLFEKLGLPYIFISAKYCFLYPHEEIENYDEKIDKLTPALVEKFRNVAVTKRLLGYDLYIIAAFSRYAELCAQVFGRDKVRTILPPKTSYFQALRYVKALLDEVESGKLTLKELIRTRLYPV